MAHRVKHGVARLVKQEVVGFAGTRQPLRQVGRKIGNSTPEHHGYGFCGREQLAGEVRIER